MKLGFRSRNSTRSPGQSLGGSLRRSETGVSPGGKSEDSSSTKRAPTSKRTLKVLKEYAKKAIDVESFSDNIRDWILEKTSGSEDGMHSFDHPFLVDELQKLDYALEGVVFQQLFRMPCAGYGSNELIEDKFFALEDFLYSIADGLWKTFWSKNGPSPFFVSCPRYPGSKFYTVEKAISRSRIEDLCGATLLVKAGKNSEIYWDHAVVHALFKPDISQGGDFGLSVGTLAEALFYGFYLMLNRCLSKQEIAGSSTVYLLVLDSRFGGVVKLRGDLGYLDVSTSDPYKSIAEWMKEHAEVNISPVDLIWNKLGNPNWGDVGTLQLILATFHSIAQWKGPPRKSVASLAADHSIRLEKRRIESHLTENGNALMYNQVQGHTQDEIVEIEPDEVHSISKQMARLKLNSGDVIVLEDSSGQKSFQILETLVSGNCLSYSAVSPDQPDEVLTVYIGSHPSRLKPSWEDMSLWYQVQRQTKVLNIMKQHGLSSKFLPELVASGQMLHPGPCQKQSPGSRCDHPLCGTPVLVTFPVGEPLSSIVARDGPFSAEEALRCCRDCLSAIRSVASANIQHGDICPEHIVRVHTITNGVGTVRYVPVSWGHAVLEDRDSPAMNLQFSSTYALQQGKLCPASDAESLVYLLYFICGGSMQQQDSIESALRWRERSWSKRSIQQQLGEVSALLKAFADYVDSLCGTPYPVDYDIWLRRLNRVVNGGADRGKLIDEGSAVVKIEDVAESSGTSGGASFHDN